MHKIYWRKNWWTFAELAEMAGVAEKTFKNRYYASKSVDAAMRTPKRGRLMKYKGMLITAKELAEEIGISYSQVRVRLERTGWDAEAAAKIKYENNRKRKAIFYEGEWHSVRSLSRKLDCSNRWLGHKIQSIGVQRAIAWAEAKNLTDEELEFFNARRYAMMDKIKLPCFKPNLYGRVGLIR